MVMETFAEEETEALDHESILARVDDWERRIRALYRDLTTWLPASFTADTIQSVETMEPRMMSFGVDARTLPVLSVFDGETWKAKVIPSGLWIYGADGRLDLLTHNSRYYILGRSPSDGGGWRLARTDGGWELVDLDRRVWLDIIR